jgi:hypothetical protein
MLQWVPEVKVCSNRGEVMVEMVTLRGTRIRFLHLFVHLIGDDFANVEEGEESSA